MAQQKRQLIESLWHRQFSSDQAEFSSDIPKGAILKMLKFQRDWFWKSDFMQIFVRDKIFTRNFEKFVH